MSRNKKLAERLLKWNRENLLASKVISESDISRCFSKAFIVRANGREYEANYTNYLEFLNRFKSTIKSIDYQVQEYVSEGNSIVIVMSAVVCRINDQSDKFEAMLLLKFDDDDLITLWQEVYINKT